MPLNSCPGDVGGRENALDLAALGLAGDGAGFGGVTQPGFGHDLHLHGMRKCADLMTITVTPR